MSGLYTVKFNRLRLVSRFDNAGAKIADTIEKIPMVMNDLPYVTALGYSQSDGFSMVEQIGSFSGGGPSIGGFKRDLPPSQYKRPAGYGIKGVRVSGRTVAEVDAATGGDMGAAINAEVADV